jgi:hypothetical protein
MALGSKGFEGLNSSFPVQIMQEDVLGSKKKREGLCWIGVHGESSLLDGS